MFMPCLNLEEIPDLFKPYWLWSSDSWNLAYFRRRDHLGNPDVSLDSAVRDFVHLKIGFRPMGPIKLMTHLCYFGYRFNPVSFYFCLRKADLSIETIVAEINNTPWGEQHCYVLKDGQIDETGKQRFVFRKQFHISPFMEMELKYVWSFSQLRDQFSVVMESWDINRKILKVSFEMNRTEISHTSLARVLLQYPFMTTKVIWGIYFQAFLLWLKKCPFYSHPKLRKVSNYNSKPRTK